MGAHHYRWSSPARYFFWVFEEDLALAYVRHGICVNFKVPKLCWMNIYRNESESYYRILFFVCLMGKVKWILSSLGLSVGVHRFLGLLVFHPFPSNLMHKMSKKTLWGQKPTHMKANTFWHLHASLLFLISSPITH